MLMEKIVNLCMRSILGIIAMYFINSALDKAGISLGVGINAFTVLTSGILGFIRYSFHLLGNSPGIHVL